MDEFMFRLGVEGEAEWNRLVHLPNGIPCGHEIEIMDYETFGVLIKVAENHQRTCKAIANG